VFLRIGDRLLLDGTLNGMASVARGAAGQLARVQTGTCTSTRSWSSPDLSPYCCGAGAMSEPAVLNLILFLPVIGMVLLRSLAVTAWCAR